MLEHRTPNFGRMLFVIRGSWFNGRHRMPYSRNEVITKVTKRRLPKYPDTYDYSGPLLFNRIFLFDTVLGKPLKRSLESSLPFHATRNANGRNGKGARKPRRNR